MSYSIKSLYIFQKLYFFINIEAAASNLDSEKQGERVTQKYSFRTRRSRQPLKTLNGENPGKTLDDTIESESDCNEDLVTDDDSDWEIDQYKSTKKESVKSYNYTRKSSVLKTEDEIPQKSTTKIRVGRKKKELSSRNSTTGKSQGKGRGRKPVVNNFLTSQSENESDEKDKECTNFSKSAIKQRRITNAHQNLLIESPQEEKFTLKPKRSLIPRINEKKSKLPNRNETSLKKLTAKIENETVRNSRLSLEKKRDRDKIHYHDKILTISDDIPSKIDIISRCHRRASADETLMSVNETFSQENIPCSTFVEDFPNTTFNLQEKITPQNSHLPDVDSEKVRRSFANVFVSSTKVSSVKEKSPTNDISAVEDKLRTFCISESTILPEKTPERNISEIFKLNENTTTWISENSAKPKILVSDTPEDNYKNPVVKNTIVNDMVSVNDSLNGSECQDEELVTEKKSDISSVIGPATGLQSSDRSDSVTTAKTPTKMTPHVSDCVKSWIHDELAESDEKISCDISHKDSSNKKKETKLEKTFVVSKKSVKASISPISDSGICKKSSNSPENKPDTDKQEKNSIDINNQTKEHSHMMGDKVKEITSKIENISHEIKTDLKHSCKVENLSGRKLIKAKSVLSSTRTSPIIEAVLHAEKQKASKPPVPENSVSEKKVKKKKSKKLTKEDVLSMHIFSSDEDNDALRITLEESRNGREIENQKTELEFKSISFNFSTSDAIEIQHEISRLSIKSESSRNDTKSSIKDSKFLKEEIRREKKEGEIQEESELKEWFVEEAEKSLQVSFEDKSNRNSDHEINGEAEIAEDNKREYPLVEEKRTGQLTDESPTSSDIKDLHQATSSGVSTRSSYSRVFSSEKKENRAVFLLSDSDEDGKDQSSSDSDLEPTGRRIVRRIDFEESDDDREENANGEESDNEEVKKARDNCE